MNQNEMEELFLKSLDQTLSDAEKEKLMNAVRVNKGFAESMNQYKEIRLSLGRKKPATFGPYFGQKVVNKIQGMRVEIDRQIVFFFKKYQLAALGIFVALLTINVVFSDQLDIASILGIQKTAIQESPEDEIETFNFFEALNNSN